MAKEIVRMKYGSQLYGTATPSSDLDIKAVHIPSAEEILLLRSPKTIQQKTGGNAEKNTADDVDFESMSLHHFMKLVDQGQPVAIEMLYAPESMILHATPEWDEIVAFRDRLVSKKANTWLGYARQQVSKFVVKGERIAAVESVLHTLQDIAAINGLQTEIGEFQWNRLLRLNNLVSIEAILLGNGHTVNHLSVCGRKVPFGATLKTAIETYQTLYDSYGRRTRATQNSDGVDWKGMSHAARVAKEGIDVLRGVPLTFPLPYADYLLDIKLGKIEYSEVTEEIEMLLQELETWANISSLPENPDASVIENIVLDNYAKTVVDKYK